MLEPTLLQPLKRQLAPSLAAALIAASLTLAACAPGAGPLSRSASSAKSNPNAANTTKQQTKKVQFNDIPNLKGWKINNDKTMVVGTDVWYGRLTFDTSHSANSTFIFYTRELPNYGWRKITSTRAQTSFLTYDRQNRVLTMAISPNRIRGSEVMITVSPREQATPLAPTPQPGAPTPAPVTLAPPPSSPQPQR
jgi:hypothetical protein